jgi:hypothetical protein
MQQPPISHKTKDIKTDILREDKENNENNVIIVIKNAGHLFHELIVTFSKTKSEGKKEIAKVSESMEKEILLYVAFTDAGIIPPPPLNTYRQYGIVENGHITVTHSEANEGKRAWYCVRFKDVQGKMGLPSASESFIII